MLLMQRVYLFLLLQYLRLSWFPIVTEEYPNGALILWAGSSGNTVVDYISARPMIEFEDQLFIYQDGINKGHIPEPTALNPLVYLTLDYAAEEG